MIIKKLCVERGATDQEPEDSPLMASFIASTSAEDRYGDIISQSWNLENYRKNPVVLFNHNAAELPVGRGSVEVVDGSLMIDIVFDKEDPRAAEIGRKVKAGFLNAVSVGFNPIEAIERSALPDGHYAKGDKGTFFKSAELLEVSVVTIPANQEAVAAKEFDQAWEKADVMITTVQAEMLFSFVEQLRGASEMHAKQADYIEALFDTAKEYKEEEEEEEEEGEKDIPVLRDDVTDFPKKGDDKKINMSNSGYPVFPVDFAERIKLEYPSIWKKGGNILGNQQFRILKRIQDNGGEPESENQEEAIRLREAWAARHLKDFRLAGTVAQMKWLVIGEKGLQHMKDTINAEIDKRKKLGSEPKDQEAKSFALLFDLLKLTD